MTKDNLDTIRALKYENSPETDGNMTDEEENIKGYNDCAYKIYTLIEAELEKNKSTDWQGTLAELGNHLTRKEVRK